MGTKFSLANGNNQTGSTVADGKPLATGDATHVNGEASNLRDVPLIDAAESLKETIDLKVSALDTAKDDSDQNGTVANSAAGTKGDESTSNKVYKKMKKPVFRLRRWLSTKSPSKPVVANGSGESKPINGISLDTQAINGEAIEKTANTLVNQAVASSEAVVASEQNDKQEPVSSEVVTEVAEPSNEVHEAKEESDHNGKVDEVPTGGFDTNNTNSAENTETTAQVETTSTTDE